MKKCTPLGLLCLLLFQTGIFAQSQVSGTVTAADNGEPLPGVSIVITGTVKGTTTDFDGHYTIEAGPEDLLQFSYLGYRTISLPADRSPLDVVMEPDAAQLDEVVIIGYGSVRKEDLTGTLDLVSSKDFVKGPVVSPQQLIQGKIAGVSIVSGGGAPGEGSNFLIRGIGSLNLNSNPLFVVDGVPLNDGGVGGTRNPLNLINPSDIEAISVLKDASATSIYGSRAANGVVIITTKKGRTGEFQFNFRTAASVYEPVRFVDILTPSEFRNIVETYGDQDDISRLGVESTSWQDLIYKTAFGFNHSFSANGAIGKVPMRASLGYTDQGGILKNDKMERVTGSLNLTPRLLEDQLKLEFNARVARTENRFADRGAIGAANSFDPTQPVYDINSPFYAYTDASGNDIGYYTYLNDAGTNQINLAPTNPVALLELINDRATVDRFVGSLKADYQLPWVPGMTLTLNGALDFSDSEGFRITPSNIPTSASGFDGARTDYTNQATNRVFDAYLNYNKTFGKHRLDATAGYAYQDFEFDNASNSSERILNTDGTLNEDASIEQSFIDKSKNVLLSYFGRVNYDFDGKYLFTATLRADASSKLNPNDRWGYFPSAAFAWNLHNEDFLGDNLFQELKLRLGYGEVGNVNGLGDYNFLTRYVVSTNTAEYQFGNAFYRTYRPEPINENLRWEVGKTLNAGLDFTLVNNRVSGSVNAYIRKTEDLISTTVVDPFTNFGNTISANIGDMENKGVELELNVVPIRTEDFEWSLNYNVALNENKITRLPDPQDVGGISGGVGNTIQRHQEGAAPFSFLVYKQIYDTNGNPIEGAYADLNGDGEINSSDRYLYKSPYADVLMGLSGNFSYRNWDLSFVSRASIGNYSYNNIASVTARTNVFQNDILRNIHADYLRTRFNQFTETNLLSDHFIENASFFRLDNVTLGYTFPEFLGSNSLRCYLTGMNLLVVTDYQGLDPEITGGIDNNFYPRPRTIIFGLDLNF
ncbi:TonB-dependent receptor [Robiginitalea sp. M366]|uniref:SusC/RagA family TonB-linked outer membrane protein n=1 Tax=Robiginitalea aestuariiviva TaxID=3036903 RepID=UPI00240E1853|nr:TonB-dependent receptor [Robiginitalea aestuariiviva]MDG1571820.1 TonB-dependent receptor [Robiginitalea aestuariiviva]